MKRVFRVIAAGPWAGGFRKDLNIPADSAEEAAEIAKTTFGATHTVNGGCWGPYTGPASLEQRADPETGFMFAKVIKPGFRPDEFGPDASH